MDSKSVPLFVTLTHPVTGKSIIYPGGLEQKHLDSAARYEATSNDIFVCAYSKCGTTWLQNIVWLIVHHGEPISKTLRKCIPMLEFDGCDTTEAIDNSQYPRIIKTHFPYEETPQNKDAKYVYITRNPKDALVSYYYHVKGFPQYYDCPDVTFEEVYKLYIQEKVEFNGFFENVGSWYEQRHQPNVLFLLYEDLKRDLRGNILKIARFLGPRYENVINANNEEILEKILENSSFKSMKKKTTQWVRILFDFVIKANSYSKITES